VNRKRHENFIHDDIEQIIKQGFGKLAEIKRNGGGWIVLLGTKA
jgi:hypothetical protein